jgi:hypothetical protein
MTEKRKQQIEELENATREIMDTEGFARWVRTRKAFHDYSINNQILIAFQPPKVNGERTAEYATQVAGYKTWQKKLDRQVVKGAEGIAIFAPIKVKDRDDDGKVKLDEQGNEKYRIFFKIVRVFDVSQTEGEALPEAPEQGSIAGEDHEGCKAGLLRLADEIGFEVRFEDLSERACGGYCDPTRKLIVVGSEVSADEQVRVLTHEIAHALGVGYAEFGRERAEVIVEAATTVALDAFGFDTGAASLPYIAGWAKDDKGLETLRHDLGKIDELAGRLEEAVRRAFADQAEAEAEIEAERASEAVAFGDAAPLAA